MALLDCFDCALALFKDRMVHRGLRHLTPTSLIKKACSRPCFVAMPHQATASAGQLGIWNLVLPLHNGAQMVGVLLFAVFCPKSWIRLLDPQVLFTFVQLLSHPGLNFSPAEIQQETNICLGLFWQKILCLY